MSLRNQDDHLVLCNWQLVVKSHAAAVSVGDFHGSVASSKMCFDKSTAESEAKQTAAKERFALALLPPIAPSLATTGDLSWAALPAPRPLAPPPPCPALAQ